MPLYTDWRLDVLARSGPSAQHAWAAGGDAELAAAAIEHTVRTGETELLGRLLEQESRNDQRSLLQPHLGTLAALEESPWRSAALALAAFGSDRSPQPLLRALRDLAVPAPATSTMMALGLAWRLADRGWWRDAARFDALAVRTLRSGDLPPERAARLRPPVEGVHAFIAWSASGDAGSADALERSLAEAIAGDGLDRTHALPLTALGRIQAARGCWQQAVACLARAVHLTPEGAAEASATAKAMLALARYRIGDWHGAAIESASARRIAERTTSPTLAAVAAALAALERALVGDVAGAQREADRAREALLRRHSVIAEAILLHARIMQLIGQRDWWALHSLVHVEQQAGALLLYTTHEWAALDAFARHHAGDIGGLRRTLAAWSEQPGASDSAYHQVHRALLADHDGDARGALAAADRARASLSLDDDPLGRAWTLWAIGGIAARHRDGEDGRRDLTHATAVLERLGADGFAEYTATLLQRSERMPPAETLEALGALTPQQRRVAELVAEGWTSAEIAERLFLSKRTIDFHVANVVERLALANRREIKRVIDAARQL